MKVLGAAVLLVAPLAVAFIPQLPVFSRRVAVHAQKLTPLNAAFPGGISPEKQKNEDYVASIPLEIPDVDTSKEGASARAVIHAVC